MSSNPSTTSWPPQPDEATYCPPSTVDLDQAAAQLAGPIFTQNIMLRATISDDLITNTTKHFLANFDELR